MEILKPCRACGETPSLEYSMVYPPDNGLRVFGVEWEVICPYCGAREDSGVTRYIVTSEGKLALVPNEVDGRAEVIRKWNEEVSCLK